MTSVQEYHLVIEDGVFKNCKLKEKINDNNRYFELIYDSVRAENFLKVIREMKVPEIKIPFEAPNFEEL